MYIVCTFYTLVLGSIFISFQCPKGHTRQYVYVCVELLKLRQTHKVPVTSSGLCVYTHTCVYVCVRVKWCRFPILILLLEGKDEQSGLEC